MENLPKKQETDRVDEAKRIIQNSSVAIENEFKRTANDWLSCMGSIIFQLECLLGTSKAEQEIGEKRFREITAKIEKAKLRLFELKNQFAELEPPQEIKNEVIKLLNILD